MRFTRQRLERPKRAPLFGGNLAPDSVAATKGRRMSKSANSPRRSRDDSRPAAPRYRRLPAHDRAALRGAREVHQGAGRGDARGQGSFCLWHRRTRPMTIRPRMPSMTSARSLHDRQVNARSTQGSRRRVRCALPDGTVKVKAHRARFMASRRVRNSSRRRSRCWTPISARPPNRGFGAHRVTSSIPM